MLEHDEDNIASPSRMDSPSLESKAEGEAGYTTPRSIKTMKRLKKLQDAPSLTNSLDFTGTNDCTPQRQKKSKGRDCTPEFCDREQDPACTTSVTNYSLQSTFTTLLNQSDTMKKSNFQLLNQVSETSARDTLQRLDSVPEAYAYPTARPPEINPGVPPMMFETGYNGMRERTYQIAQMIVRLYYYTFNQRSETLGKLFVRKG